MDSGVTVLDDAPLRTDYPLTQPEVRAHRLILFNLLFSLGMVHTNDRTWRKIVSADLVWHALAANDLYQISSD